MTGRKRIIGLVGGIGSGKSRVAESFARHGGFIIIGDALGHEALRQPEIKDQARRRWGEAIFDEHGEIVRRRLSQIVFANAEERQVLEALTFPYIGRRIHEETDKAQADPNVRFVVLDAAVMLEAGWNNYCDWLVYVHTPRRQRLQRLLEQRGWTEEEVNARAAAQWSLADKVTAADAALDNSGSPEDLDRQVASLLKQLSFPESAGNELKRTNDSNPSPRP